MYAGRGGAASFIANLADLSNSSALQKEHRNPATHKIHNTPNQRPKRSTRFPDQVGIEARVDSVIVDEATIEVDLGKGARVSEAEGPGSGVDHAAAGCWSQWNGGRHRPLS
ncbi:hypothetical protein F5887DRAFT_912533 [Amanita rubescens]|nr:hypothetical protein F5887DRAFT_912533 [Amanita rubescens]